MYGFEVHMCECSDRRRNYIYEAVLENRELQDFVSLKYKLFHGPSFFTASIVQIICMHYSHLTEQRGGALRIEGKFHHVEKTPEVFSSLKFSWTLLVNKFRNSKNHFFKTQLDFSHIFQVKSHHMFEFVRPSPPMVIPVEVLRLLQDCYISFMIGDDLSNVPYWQDAACIEHDIQEYTEDGWRSQSARSPCQ
jgi:hypothetical protein